MGHPKYQYKGSGENSSSEQPKKTKNFLIETEKSNTGRKLRPTKFCVE